MPLSHPLRSSQPGISSATAARRLQDPDQSIEWMTLTYRLQDLADLVDPRAILLVMDKGAVGGRNHGDLPVIQPYRGLYGGIEW